METWLATIVPSEVSFAIAVCTFVIGTRSVRYASPDFWFAPESTLSTYPPHPRVSWIARFVVSERSETRRRRSTE